MCVLVFFLALDVEENALAVALLLLERSEWVYIYIYIYGWLLELVVCVQTTQYVVEPHEMLVEVVSTREKPG